MLPGARPAPGRLLTRAVAYLTANISQLDLQLEVLVLNSEPRTMVRVSFTSL